MKREILDLTCDLCGKGEKIPLYKRMADNGWFKGEYQIGAGPDYFEKHVCPGCVVTIAQWKQKNLQIEAQKKQEQEALK
jgi:hypothetical protein